MKSKSIFSLFLILTGLALPGVSGEVYVSNPVRLETVRSVSAAHILVATRPEAVALKKRIQNGEKFEDLAKEYSLCPSGKERGGHLGSFTRGQMVKPFENAAFNLKPGQISEPVKTDFGWHLIKVYDRNTI